MESIRKFLQSKLNFSSKSSDIKTKDQTQTFVSETESSAQPSFTFNVDNVKQNKVLCMNGYSPEMVLKEKTTSTVKIEDFSHKDAKTKLLPSDINNGLMNAIHFAYINHYPLKLSVSDFILMIGQGIAKHMEVHAEELRSQFVDFDGKKEIVIVRTDLVPGLKNDWSTIFEEFSVKIQNHVQTDLYDVLIDDTSVATKISKIASEVAIMDAYKHYFEYVVQIGCGFPKLTLVGSNEDWEKLRSKVKKLQEINTADKLKLNWWLERLVPLVDTIVDQATSRNIDKAFWSNMYHSQKHGGIYVPTPMISGWITIFHPYLERNKNNPPFLVSGKYEREYYKNSFDEVHPSNLINGVSKVPFKWRKPNGEDIKMNIYGGCLGAQMLQCTTVEPVYFYAVTYDE